MPEARLFPISTTLTGISNLPVHLTHGVILRIHLGEQLLPFCSIWCLFRSSRF